jgi:ubiquinone/menaquinone biosynthesis C-methylase UbiE
MEVEFMLDFTEIKICQQKTWASGNYSYAALQLNYLSETFCESIDLSPGEKVLDVATGSGNTALAAARRLCEVTGVDYVASLLDKGRKRAEVDGIKLVLIEGDAEQLPFPDNSFDVVLSTYGAMFAPNQEKTANEMVRTARQGGKIAMVNWAPDSFIGDLFRLISRLVPPVPGLKSPLLWGTKDRLEELFGDQISTLQVARKTFYWRARSAEDFIGLYLTNYGPTLKAYEALDENGQKELIIGMNELISRSNVSVNNTVKLPYDYVEVLAIKR